MARNKYPEDKRNSPFASALRKLMSERGTTQEDLAQVTEKTRQTVSQYANGISEPGYETLVKIADYFNVSTDYLLGIKTDPSRVPCAADDLRLSTATIDIIRGLSETERAGFEKMVSSELLKVLCNQLAIFNELPPYSDPRYDLLGEYVNADLNERKIESEILEMHPEMQGSFSVLCGVNHAEQLKRQILNSIEMMLSQMDWSKINRN